MEVIITHLFFVFIDLYMKIKLKLLIQIVYWSINDYL